MADSKEVTIGRRAAETSLYVVTVARQNAEGATLERYLDTEKALREALNAPSKHRAALLSPDDEVRRAAEAEDLIRECLEKVLPGRRVIEQGTLADRLDKWLNNYKVYSHARR